MMTRLGFGAVSAPSRAISEIQQAARVELEDGHYPTYAAEIAYNVADALIKAREKSS